MRSDRQRSKKFIQQINELKDPTYEKFLDHYIADDRPTRGISMRTVDAFEVLMESNYTSPLSASITPDASSP